MSIDKQRVRAVEKLYQLGWEFKDNNWVEPKRATSTTELPSINIDDKYKEAIKIIEIHGGTYDEINKCWNFSAGSIDQKYQDAINALRRIDHMLKGTTFQTAFNNILFSYGVNL